MNCIAQCFSRTSESVFFNTDNIQTIKVTIPHLTLNIGTYTISIHFIDASDTVTRGKIIQRFDSIKKFSVGGSVVGYAPVLFEARWDVVKKWGFGRVCLKQKS